jgi:hypothetical protein
MASRTPPSVSALNVGRSASTSRSGQVQPWFSTVGALRDRVLSALLLCMNGAVSGSHRGACRGRPGTAPVPPSLAAAIAAVSERLATRASSRSPAAAASSCGHQTIARARMGCCQLGRRHGHERRRAVDRYSGGRPPARADLGDDRAGKVAGAARGRGGDQSVMTVPAAACGVAPAGEHPCEVPDVLADEQACDRRLPAAPAVREVA